MPKYRKKPVMIEAMQWLGFDKSTNPDVLRDKARDHRICEKCNEPLLKHGRVKTLEGSHIVCPGDWIITGIKGEKYPCKPDIFEQTYEKIE